MASPRSVGENGADGADAVGDAFQLVAQGLAQLQEALRRQQQEAERKVQEALRLEKQEAELKVQEALRLQEEAELRTQEALRLQEQRAATAMREMERKLQEKDDALRALQQRLERHERVTAVERRTTTSGEALLLQEERAATALREMERKLQERDDALRALQQRLERQERVAAVQTRTTDSTEAQRLQEERAATAMREMERKLQEKDDAIRALQRRLEETQERVAAVEERTSAPEGSGGEGGLQRLEGRVNDVEASLQSAIQTFVPRVESLLRQLEEPESTRASLATSAASARDAPATEGAAAGDGEEPPSTTSIPTSSGTGHHGAAANEGERARQRVELPLPQRLREVELRREEAQNSPCPLGEQLCEAADGGRLNDVLILIDCGANVNYMARDGYTPLFSAAWMAHADVVSLLLQRGADANAIACGSGTSVLHFAAAKDPSGRCVELLVGAGADVDARDLDGETPLHRAAYRNNEGAVRALLAAGARRDLKVCKGRWKNKTPLKLATSPAVQDLLRG